ncbi:uncharacterized protein CLUP02_04451 [Colletotrichum lupini]|uniref:Uncharacterized protein n=1 Tax=Colletotrichum lupini TaxID=145971 RepID=A0A9Q8SKC1_9PEZI|nr:uncharacterized protein CLUP02_04451 [Colletotrichum lupini]UQC78972.1 hypothetical protein CLUP02_04451 [Colletotrichum lupini]
MKVKVYSDDVVKIRWLFMGPDGLSARGNSVADSRPVFELTL